MLGLADMFAASINGRLISCDDFARSFLTRDNLI